jgi:hypothetical protein
LLNALFAKDQGNVFFLSGKIREAKAATFRALDRGWFIDSWGMESYQGYAADREQVFHYVLTIGKPRLIKGADVGSFRVLEHGLCRRPGAGLL